MESWYLRVKEEQLWRICAWVWPGQHWAGSVSWRSTRGTKSNTLRKISDSLRWQTKLGSNRNQNQNQKKASTSSEIWNADNPGYTRNGINHARDTTSDNNRVERGQAKLTSQVTNGCNKLTRDAIKTNQPLDHRYIIQVSYLLHHDRE